MKSAVQRQQSCVPISKRTAIFKPKGCYSSYIYKKLKQVNPDRGCVEVVRRSSPLELIATEAARLSLYNKRRTITSDEVCTALHRSVPAQ
ncbi:uncharacterized protein LOC129694405 [Leucoraja erinacea]|uniref:uncharacterized protein LOC129694405 n=1 Tax=Leucoraja erinaceus TaxID=7782 RepID=UPI0024561BDC|nr:uncharacterized protein LOC129694405 [Leucoraja erinacea]